MYPDEELLQIASRLDNTATEIRTLPDFQRLSKLKEVAGEVGKSWGGSWLGYHAFVYYKDLTPPPPGRHFSSEWGMKQTYAVQGSTGDWYEYSPDTVKETIYELAENPDVIQISKEAKKAENIFDDCKHDALSIISTAVSEQSDPFLESLKESIEVCEIMKPYDYLNRIKPSGQIMSRDTLAITQGIKVPPHQQVIAEVIGVEGPINSCSALASLCKKAGSHLQRKRLSQTKKDVIGTNVFIGHGRSSAWKDLKDFIQDRIRLPWDEFNRVPVAGISNITRLSEMLDSAAIAFLVMTGEDERLDGTLQARMNVIHEAGLFQGRLGFTRAIVLLEEGCEEFSNIQGLGQIRFPKDNIKAAFEEIRRVLEREGLINSD